MATTLAAVTPSDIAPEPSPLGRLAHDIRSPLTVLVCNRKFLQEMLAGPAPDLSVVEEILADDAAALARLERIIGSMDGIGRRR